MTELNTRIKVEVKRVVNLGDYNSIAYSVGVEEDVPEDKKTSQHIKDTTHNIELLLTKKLTELGKIELDD